MLVALSKAFMERVYIYLKSLNLRPESKQEPVKTEMGPPPSPASTCSDASSIASSASMPYSKFWEKECRVWFSVKSCRGAKSASSTDVL